MSKKTLAILGLVVVAGGFALLSVGTRLMNEGFGPLTQVYMRIALGAVVSIIIFGRRVRWAKLLTVSRTDWLILLLMGVVGYAVSVYFVTLGTLQTKLMNVSVVAATVVFFSYVYSVLVLKTKFKWGVVGLVVMSLIGVGMIATRSLVPMVSDLGMGEVWVLLYAATAAWYYVGRKMLSNNLTTIEISVMTLGIAAVAAFGMAVVAGEKLNWTAFGDWRVMLGLGMGSLFNIVAAFVENFAFKHLEAVVGSQVLLLENVFAVVLGYVLYHEVVGGVELVGTMLVVTAVYLANKQVQD